MIVLTAGLAAVFTLAVAAVVRGQRPHRFALGLSIALAVLTLSGGVAAAARWHDCGTTTAYTGPLEPTLGVPPDVKLAPSPACPDAPAPFGIRDPWG